MLSNFEPGLLALIVEIYLDYIQPTRRRLLLQSTKLKLVVAQSAHKVLRVLKEQPGLKEQLVLRVQSELKAQRDHKAQLEPKEQPGLRVPQAHRAQLVHRGLKVLDLHFVELGLLEPPMSLTTLY